MFRLKAIALSILLAAGAEAATLTLEEAIAIAVEQNRGIERSNLEVAKAADRLAANRTRLYPSLSVSALGAQQLRAFEFTIERGVLGTYSGTGPLPNEDVHLKSPLAPTGIFMAKVQQPLTSLIRIRRNLASLKTGVELAKEQTRADRQKVVREVRRVYYALQQVDSGVRTARQMVALYRELTRLTENYVAGQVVLKADLLEAQTKLAKAEESEAELLDQQSTAKEQLNLLLGRDVLTEFEVQPLADTVDDIVPLAAARERALAQRPEVRQAKLRQMQAEQDVRAKKAEYIPDVAAEFNNLSFLNFGAYFPPTSTSIGISVTWEPFDWGRKRHEIAEKRRTVEQAKAAGSDAEASVLIEVNEKYRQLRRSKAQLNLARMQRESAMEGLRVTRNRYAVEAALLKDVLQGQAGLEQSDAEYQQALVSFWNARADFERALGEEK
jgi:outer membrane protein TolC